MSRVKEVKPNILCLEYRQDKEDHDYGSCMWARFMFNLDRYELSIISDCGNMAYGWCETPSESFLQLMARVNDHYLLEKLYGRPNIFNYSATKEKFYELYGEEPEDREKLDEIFEEMEVYGGEPDNSSEFMRVFEDNNHNDFCDAWEYLEFDYPAGAIKIVQIFKKEIQPWIRKHIEENANE